MCVRGEGCISCTFLYPLLGISEKWSMFLNDAYEVNVGVQMCRRTQKKML